jgi:hypothetical protein
MRAFDDLDDAYASTQEEVTPGQYVALSNNQGARSNL